jgi:hypothetical protein
VPIEDTVGAMAEQVAAGKVRPRDCREQIDIESTFPADTAMDATFR